MRHTKWILLTIIASSLMITACKKKDDDTTEESVSDATSNAIEMSLSTAQGAANSSEGVAVRIDSVDESGTAEGAIHASATECASVSSLRSCTGTTCTITWNDCTVTNGKGDTITMSGTWSETYSAAGCTSSFSSGCSMTRTSDGSVMTMASGATVTTSTTSHTNYEGTTIPATGTQISNSSGTRTITINGIHRVMKGPKGRKWFDHSITGSLSATGSKSGGNRVITGTNTVYHNLLSYKVANTFNSVTWGSTSCNYPTSGSISSTVSGSISGTTTLTFTTTCGSATFVGTDGSSSTVQLNFRE